MVFRGGGGADVSRCNVLFRGVGGLMSCDPEDATWCSEGVAGMMSCNAQGATYYSERVSGFDALCCSKCNTVFR